LRCPLTGLYQQENIVTVLQTIDELIRLGYDIRKQHLVKGVNDVIKQTGLLGRYQVIGRSPLIICDTAHNPDGLRMVLAQLEKEPHERFHLVLGVVGDKEVSKAMKVLPKGATYYFCKADIPRGMDATELKTLAGSFGLKGMSYPSVKEALKAAQTSATSRDLIFVGGSTFTVAEVI